MDDLNLIPPHPPSVVYDAARLAALAEYNILDTAPEEGFEDIVHLAAHICNVPVALVSLVAEDRQWFKARVGFEPCETDLSSSVCAHALLEQDLLIIPDLSRDPRTAANPLVTSGPKIRFYAGAPLRTPEGQAIGSLCVIDGLARPGGLTAEQARMLRTLARQVMALMALRRAVTVRDSLVAQHIQVEKQMGESAASLKISEAHWRGLFERLDEGFIVGEIIRDADGAIADWRYVDVNAAWGELVGIDPPNVIGRTIREVFPGIEDEWVHEFASVVETGQASVFTRQVGSLQRWYEGRAFALDADRFAVIFLEVTSRLKSEKRRDALLELNDRLRDLDDASEIIRTASTIVGRTLGLSRAGFCRLEDGGRFVEIQCDWALEGLVSVAGRRRIDDYGEFSRSMTRSSPLIVEDVLIDSLTAEKPDALIRLGTRALVHIPVAIRGTTVALLFVHSATPRVWTPETIGFLRNVADLVELSVNRVKAKDDQILLNQEMSHRLKNSMSMVQAIARQTLKAATDRETVNTFSKRISALARAHDVLLQRSWTAGPAHKIVESALGSLGMEGRFDISGPALPLGPRTTLALSLLLHELTTNAVKYGALSADAGRVAISWHLQDTDIGKLLVLEWRESGGPAAVEPSRKGFGSRLIGSGLVGSGGVDMRYVASGLEVRMTAPLDQVQLS